MRTGWRGGCWTFSIGCTGHIEVCSIDGFQGREAEIVVFVTVRCNPHLEIVFLKDRRRLNVALTRAKRGIVLVGKVDANDGDVGSREC
jgi:superfamily I DNA and/or RNA helicase